MTTLLVDKADQLGAAIGALLSRDAELPGIDIASVDRIWVCAVSAGHVMQSTNLWTFIRAKLDPEKTASYAHEKVKPLQIFDLEDYEKLLAFVEAGHDLGAALERKTSGPFRDRDLAAWFHGDPAAPSDKARMKLLEERWEAMSEDVVAVVGRNAPAVGERSPHREKRADAWPTGMPGRDG